MVARLQYAATWVHFDISFTVAQLLVARLCASAGPTHWAALHHVIEYLAKHSSLKLGAGRSHRHQKVLMVSVPMRIGSTAAILWRSKQQKMISLSNAEAEHYAASDGVIQGFQPSTFVDSLSTRVSTRTPEDGLHSTRTTTRALNGETM
jgi:hypothetical protein